MQDDAIHPNPEGHRKVARTLLDAITPLVGAPADR
jgi:lysophospholipase L1-like esterase